jgi:polyphosphate kinase 2 (PPK2 family)
MLFCAPNKWRLRYGEKEIFDLRYVDPFRVTDGEGFRLKDFDPGSTCDLQLDKGDAAGHRLSRGGEEMLYAQGHRSILLVFQAMDAAGKDSTIKHVMSGVNPQGCQVFSFKKPLSEDISHDFLCPSGGGSEFQPFYYEEVLIVRVHEEILQRQKLPQAHRQEHF